MAACVAVALVLWSSSGSHAYAAAAEALQRVRTVHITGWTTKPERRHSVAAVTAATAPSVKEQQTVEEWEWTADDGTPRRFSVQGTVTVWDDGQRRYEHQQERNRLFIDESDKSGGAATKFAALMQRLEDLKRPGMKKTDLGEQKDDAGRTIRGLRIEKPRERRQELWFDVETRLPVRLSASEWKDGTWSPVRELAVTYDEPVAETVASYSPPEDAERHIASSIDVRFDAWHQRLAARYKGKLPPRMELVPHGPGESFEAYSFGKLPGIKTHVVRPLGGIPPMKSATLRDHLHAFWWESPGTLRVPRELGDMQLNHDLVLQSDVPTREQLAFLLNGLGLELVEVTEPTKVWVARYDGRKLTDWREVKAPVPNPQNKPLHPGMASGFGPTTMADLFRGLMFYQDMELTAKQVRIIDETGLATAAPGAEPQAVASESPYFGGREALPIAKKWFAEQFGVTFTEEVREQQVHVVRRR